MEYTYSRFYGDRLQRVARKRLRDERGDELLWQHEHDAAVDKGLMQNMKESTYSFVKLLKTLRAETAKHMHACDQQRLPAYQLLDKYQGPGYACAEGTPIGEALRWYWYDHLGVPHTG